jgi:hypothetical protein
MRMSEEIWQIRAMGGLVLTLCFFPSHSCDWPDFLQLCDITDTSVSFKLLQHPPEPDSASLKEEKVHSSEMSKNTSIVQGTNPKENHHGNIILGSKTVDCVVCHIHAVVISVLTDSVEFRMYPIMSVCSNHNVPDLYYTVSTLRSQMWQ